MRIGIEFGGTHIKMGIVSDDGIVVRYNEKKLANLTDSEGIVQSLKQAVFDFIGDENIEKGGISAKGLVDTDKGQVIDDVGAGRLLIGVPLCEIFSKKYNVPFQMDNDARCYAWGEWKFGHGKGTKVFTCMTLGTGVGCALIHNGEIYYGSDPLGGILGGHLSINKDGPECNCGNKGCLELYCSQTGLLRIFERTIPSILSNDDPIKSFFNMVRQGEMFYNKIFNAFINDLAIGLVNIIHTYSPEVIVLGGGILKSADIILPPLQKYVNKMAFTVPRGRCVIKSSELGNHAPILGAAFHPKLGK